MLEALTTSLLNLYHGCTQLLAEVALAHQSRQPYVGLSFDYVQRTIGHDLLFQLDILHVQITTYTMNMEVKIICITFKVLGAIEICWWSLHPLCWPFWKCQMRQLCQGVHWDLTFYFSYFLWIKLLPPFTFAICTQKRSQTYTIILILMKIKLPHIITCKLNYFYYK